MGVQACRLPALKPLKPSKPSKRLKTLKRWLGMLHPAANSQWSMPKGLFKRPIRSHWCVALGCLCMPGKCLRDVALGQLAGCEIGLTLESEEGEVPHLRWSQAPPLPWPRPGSADIAWYCPSLFNHLFHEFWWFNAYVSCLNCQTFPSHHFSIHDLSYFEMSSTWPFSPPRLALTFVAPTLAPRQMAAGAPGWAKGKRSTLLINMVVGCCRGGINNVLTTLIAVIIMMMIA